MLGDFPDSQLDNLANGTPIDLAANVTLECIIPVLVPLMKQHRVLIDKSIFDEKDQFIEPNGFIFQLEHYPEGKHDDRLDAVYMAIHYLDMPLISLNLQGPNPGIQGNLHHILPFARNLMELDLSETDLEDKDLEHITALTNLRKLNLACNKRITLEKLRNFTIMQLPPL